MIPSCSLLAAAPVAGGGGGGGGGGGTPATISISNASATGATADGSEAFAAYRLKSTGEAETETADLGIASLGAWISDATQTGNYDARATVSSGALTSGTAGSWLALSTTREWGVADDTPGGGAASVVLTIEIRLRSSGVVQATATVTLTARTVNTPPGP